jgi:Flp pilus assembly protein CpaB
MPRTYRLSRSIAGTAAVALASLPLAVSPASAAKVSQESTASIRVMEESSNAQQFNLKTQGASTVLVAGRPLPAGKQFHLRFLKIQFCNNRIPYFFEIPFCQPY